MKKYGFRDEKRKKRDEMSVSRICMQKRERERMKRILKIGKF